MIKRWLPVLLLAVGIWSCKSDPNQSLRDMSRLKGSWVSINHTQLFFRWNNSVSGLAGVSYSLRKTDTLFLNRFELSVINDSLFLDLSSAGGKKQTKRYHLESDHFGKYKFKSQQDVYPFRIIFSFENDTLWSYKQENIRGNKVIEFELKPIKP